jgi:hypothetical protein
MHLMQETRLDATRLHFLDEHVNLSLKWVYNRNPKTIQKGQVRTPYYNI